MRDDFGNTLFGFVLGFSIGVFFFAFILSITDSTYKDGQIDALTGKVKYELVEHEDKTMSWEMIEDNENK